MRRFLLLLALLGGVFFTLGAGASTASAANCSVSATQIFYNGSKLQYSHIASGCSGVDVVEFSPLANFGYIVTGIVNNNTGAYHPNASPPTLLDVQCGRIGVIFGGSCGWVGFVSLWGCGPVPQNLYSTSAFRIHSTSSGQWGPWNFRTSQVQNLNC